MKKERKTLPFHSIKNLYLKLTKLLKYLRSCVKKADKIANSSSVLSLAIEQARTEIKVTNSQFFILKTS